jgi:serine protease Do
VTLEVLRSGKLQQVKLTLGGATLLDQGAADMAWNRLGLKLDRASADAVTKSNKQLNGGLSIEDVRAESPASKAGLQKGDILVGLHQWEMLSLDNVSFVLTHPDLSSFSPLRFYIIRNGQRFRSRNASPLRQTPSPSRTSPGVRSRGST